MVFGIFLRARLSETLLEVPDVNPQTALCLSGVVGRADGTPTENKPLRGYSRRIDFTEAFWAMTKSPEGTAANSQGWSVAEPLVVRGNPIIQAPTGRQTINRMLAR